MCEGKIVAPSPKPRRREVKKRNLLKSIWDYVCRVIDSAIDYDRCNYPVVSLDLPEVNMCLQCGDLEIYDNWLRIPHPSKPRISEAIKSGAITINGKLTVCHFCASAGKGIEEKRTNIFLDFDITPVSSASF